MTLLNPTGLLLLLFMPLVVLLHLRRPSRRRIEVSTLQFWNSALSERSKVSSVAWKLLLSPSLFLQLLIILVGALAAADPSISLAEKGWPRTILIVDNSASTLATDVPGGRIAAIKSEAEKTVANLRPGQQAMILETGIRPKVDVTFTADQRELDRALQEISPVGGPANIDEALRLAAQIARDGQQADIQLFTDASTSPPASVTDQPPIHWHVVGNNHNNIGITGFEVRSTQQQASHFEAFLTLVNFGDAPSKLTLQLSVSDSVFYSEKVELPPHVRRSYAIPFAHQGGGVLKAQIDSHDDLAVDNVVYAVLPDSRPRKIVLVSRGNFFLQAALRANPDFAVESITPELLRSDSSKADVVVLDRVSPDDLPADGLPPGDYLLIQTLPRGVPITQIGTVEFPSALAWDQSSPISRYLDLSNLVIRRALKVQPTGDCTEPVEAAQTPLVVACSGRTGRTVFIGFDVLQSELPLRAGLPILLANAVSWLSPSRLEDRPAYLRAGDRFAAEFSPKVSVAEIARPDGKHESVPVTDGHLIYVGTETPGLYSVKAGAAHIFFAVNLLDESKSNTARRAFTPSSDGTVSPAPGYRYKSRYWRILVLIAILAMAVEFGYFFQSEGRPPIAALVLSGMALAILITALFKPTISVASSAASVAFLVDVSNSITGEQKQRALDQVLKAAQAKRADDNVQIITFAGNAGLIDPSSGADRALSSSERTPDRTDIANAITLALGSLPKEDARRIVLVSDGNENFGDASSEAWQARQQHVQIYPVPTSEFDQSEVSIQDLALPTVVHRGEVFNVKIIVWSSDAQRATLSLDKDGVPIHSAQVDLVHGKNVLIFRDSSDEERVHRYRVSIESPKDTLRNNNVAEGAVGVRGEPRALLATSDVDRVHNLVDALQAQHFTVKTIPAEGMPGEMRKLNDYDTLILDNVPAERLSSEGMQAIYRYVAHDGGGLLMIGGENSFGLGGYEGTPLEDLLPVNMNPRAKIEVPSQAVVIVIDRSGSMSTEQAQRSRIDLAKQAAQESIAMLSEKTQVGVLAFDTEADWIVPIQPAKDKDAIERHIGTIDTGGGGTEMLTALEEAYHGLQNQKAMLKHIIILSDGEAPEKHFQELLTQVQQDRITVSTIAISSEAGQDLLRKIALWGGGRYYFTNDLYALPRILTTETRLASNRGFVEESFRPAIGRRFNEILKGIDWTAAPSLQGYVTTTLKPLAEPLLLSPHDDPVLAGWHSGLGRTVAFTSDLTGRWGRSWLEWPEFPKFVAQLVRWTVRAPPESLVSHLSIEDAQGKLSLDVADDRGNYVDFLDGEVGIIYPDKSRIVVPLLQSGPGRYVGTFPAKMKGLYLAGVSIGGRDHTPPKTALSATSVPQSIEDRILAVNMPLMQRLAEITDGRVLANPQDIFPLSGTSMRQLSIWTWLILLALVLLTLQLLLRWTSDPAQNPQDLEADPGRTSEHWASAA